MSMNPAKKRVRIVSTGSYLPEKVLTNFDLEKMVDTTDEWITTRTGIKRRHIAKESEATSDLVLQAALRALKKAKLQASDLDVLIIGTVTPDTSYPSTACWVQRGLGIEGIPCFDLSAACSGFLYGLVLAESLINAGTARRVLVAGSECLSKFLNWEDRNTCVLFGDGAGAVIVEASHDDSGMLSFSWGANGNYTDILVQPAGGSRMPPSEKTVMKKLHSVYMEGNKVFRWAVKYMSESALDAVQKAGLKADQISLFIPHQANIRIIESASKYAGIPEEKTYVVIDRTANISSATIPIALDMAIEEGRVQRGDNVLLTAFGGGLTWASIVLRW